VLLEPGPHLGAERGELRRLVCPQAPGTHAVLLPRVSTLSAPDRILCIR